MHFAGGSAQNAISPSETTIEYKTQNGSRVYAIIIWRLAGKKGTGLFRIAPVWSTLCKQEGGAENLAANRRTNML
jgi:hypothetical protein